ncbi:MAG: D-alanine--D-alanine ligase [Synergistaceae bacterium]|jgi:D-alanine-D-alanine ligase|nr:D-alanine--D-alanine ligase [Synergistaceae bacterium]
MGIRVGVFFGGRSVEHEVSIISAIQAINAFDASKYDVTPVYCARDGSMYVGERVARIEEYRDIPLLVKRSKRVVCVRDAGRFTLSYYPARRLGSSFHAEIDVAFPIVHGTNVEDGALQGFFRTLGVPFVGPDVTASAVGMDKYVQKVVFRDNGIPVLDCCRVFVKDYFADADAAVGEIERAVGYPAIVKPANLGSSIGIKVAQDARALREALDYAFQYSDTALAERAVQNLREINCAVLGDQESAEASECEEPISADEMLTYEDKYVSGEKGGAKGMGSARRVLPADIPQETREKVRGLALKAFRALCCAGVARLDFLMDASSGEVWLNEINTIPGSLSFYLWEPVGLPYRDLLDRLVSLALKRSREDAAIDYSFETNILTNLRPGNLKAAKR